MRFRHFKIQNYKGIESVTLDLYRSPASKVHTLIGLNESGKTTILEAINLLSYRDNADVRDNVSALELPGHGQYEPHELIPISKRSNFNDKISVEAEVEMDRDDMKRIVNEMWQRDGVTVTSLPDTFRVVHWYAFKSSRALSDQPQVTWDLKIEGKTRDQPQEGILEGQAFGTAISIVQQLLPRVVYFPNFLFDFPDKIYLDPAGKSSQKHEFYRTVLQDVLSALKEDINLQDHVLARAQSPLEADKRALESVLLKMGGHISESVFKNWDRVLRRPGDQGRQSQKEILVTIDKDAEGHYLQLRLKDGLEQYSIAERSLGFRWFFAYLLCTNYRGFRETDSKNVVFLLDEPASNLHPSAQTQLLDSFDKLGDRCQIVYTTHSHHMIKPEWLEGAYVVKNAGLDYSTDEQQFSAKRTHVTLTRYRKFAATYPDQTTYFQPVLDVLNYSPNQLEMATDVVMVEGKNDFYTLRFIESLLGAQTRVGLLPGTGAGTLADVIRLYVGWARNFIVLLDSDAEAVKQQSRYEEMFNGLVSQRIFRLEDFVPELAGHSLEDLFTETERMSIQSVTSPGVAHFSKTHFCRAVQEHTLTRKKAPPISHETLLRAQKLVTGLHEKLAKGKRMLLD